MNRVDGKVALVSGAARGIGAETAATLAKAGAKVVLTDMLEAAGEATAADIVAAGGAAIFRRHDVTSEADWAAATTAAVDAFGGLDILVNNAGVYLVKSIEAMTLAEWRRLSAVNLEGVFLGTKYAIGAMKTATATSPAGGSIVNLSSIAGLVGSPFGSAYHASKGGVRLFTKSAALECAQLGYGIRVNSVHPAVIDTEMGRIVVDRLAAKGSEETAREQLTALHPIGRLGEAADVARAILFLASDDSSFLTGTELVVDGGFTAR